VEVLFSAPTKDTLPEAYARITQFVRDDLGAVPTNYVIDRAGIVRYASTGAFEEDSLNALIGPLLTAPRPAITKPTPT
jgi:hypothetical protein